MIGKKVRTVLNTSQLSRSSKNDILFYVIYAVMAKLLHKNEFSFGDFLGFNVGLLDDNAVNEAIGLVNEKYVEKGASGVIAKSSTFINDIDEALNQ